MSHLSDRLGQRAAERTPDWWRTIEPIIDASLELPEAERDAYVRSVCGRDPAMLADVERLLTAYDGTDDKLDEPAARRFASLLEDGPEHLPEILGGRYRIGRVLGRGGMATVFLADDIRHDRQVAVKVLHSAVAAALGSELFLAEIRTTAQLQHSHILPLHDSGEADGLLFYVIPYEADGTLRQRINHENPVLLDEAVRIARDVASALDAAHRRGVIHRDIKPENILLRDGTPLVADFGIALAASSAAANDPAMPRSILGTRRYMSPEQASAAGTIDHRTDVYSLAIVVEEMLVRTRASEALIPPAFDIAIARARSASPEDRFASAGEFAAALQQAVAPTVVSSGPPRDRRSVARRVAPMVVGFLVVVVAAFAIVARWRASTPQRQPTASQQAIDLYNQGVAWLDRRTPEGVIKAERYFKDAIARDSNFSEAYAGLADTYTVYGIGNIGDYEPNEYFPKARQAAERALVLNSRSAAAHVARAQVRMFYDYDWSGAEDDLRRAKDLDPQYVFARSISLVLLEFTGQFELAVAEAREAVRMDKLTMLTNVELGRALFFARRFEEASTQLARILERDSAQYRAHLLLGQIFAEQRKYDSAVVEMRRAVGGAPHSSRVHAYLANVCARSGRMDEALSELRGLEEKARHSYVPAFDLAVAYAGLGKKDETFTWLGKSIVDHSIRPYLQDATFDVIRADPRYAALQARLHLPYKVRPM